MIFCNEGTAVYLVLFLSLWTLICAGGAWLLYTRMGKHAKVYYLIGISGGYLAGLFIGCRVVLQTMAAG